MRTTGATEADRTRLLIVASVVGGWDAVIVGPAVGTTLAVATRQRAAELALLQHTSQVARHKASGSALRRRASGSSPGSCPAPALLGASVMRWLAALAPWLRPLAAGLGDRCREGGRPGQEGRM